MHFFIAEAVTEEFITAKGFQLLCSSSLSELWSVTCWLVRGQCKQLFLPQHYQIGSLKSAVDGAFTPQELTDAVEQDFTPKEQLTEHLPIYHLGELLSCEPKYNDGEKIFEFV